MRNYLIILAAIICSSMAAVSIAQVPVTSEDTAAVRQQSSKLYATYGNLPNIDQLVNSSLNSKSDEITVVSSLMSHHFRKKLPDSTRGAYLLSAAANSDLVIIGEPRERNSGLTDGHGFVYSDYVMAVDRVLANRRTAVLAGQTIVVSRPGGIMRYREKKISASVPGFPLFRLNERYVLFLHFMPDTGSFIVVGQSAFDVQNERVDVGSDGSVVKNIDKQEFLGDVETATSRSFGGER